MSEATVVKTKKQMSRDKRQNIVVLCVFVFMMVLFGALSPYFLTPANLIALLVAAVPLGLIGVGQSCCLLTGQFDMAPGMVASLAGILWTWLITAFNVPTYLAFAVGLLFGVVSGLICGLSVSIMKMPAWISSYALMQCWRGIIFIITNGDAIRMTKYQDFKWLGQHKIFGTSITPAVVILILAFVVMYLILRFTKLGRDLYIIGGNMEAAKNVGVDIVRGQTFVFTLCGALSALGGLLFASRSGSGQPVIGDLYNMQAIAGAVIGGTAMTGGKTNMAMTFVGIMCMVVLQNGLNMIGVPSFYQHLATGLAVVLAIWVQTERRK